jgi:hypothetical protein
MVIEHHRALAPRVSTKGRTMSDARSRRLAGHFRRHGIAYAALTVAFSFSPVPSMAADLVTTAEIANGAVTQPKLAADSVVSGKILNESINGSDIKNGAVTGKDVLDDTITSADIHSINSSDIELGSLAGPLFEEGAVGSYEIANGSIKGDDLNLFNDNQCTGETVQGTALIDTHPSMPYQWTTSYVAYGHSCTGATVRVRRAAEGVYVVDFGDTFPGRLAVIQVTGPYAGPVPTFTVKHSENGQFVVEQRYPYDDSVFEGQWIDAMDFAILVY